MSRSRTVHTTTLTTSVFCWSIPQPLTTKQLSYFGLSPFSAFCESQEKHCDDHQFISTQCGLFGTVVLIVLTEAPVAVLYLISNGVLSQSCFSKHLGDITGCSILPNAFSLSFFSLSFPFYLHDLLLLLISSNDPSFWVLYLQTFDTDMTSIWIQSTNTFSIFYN